MMRILFTGGGTGGHFYPIIAVKEAANKIIKEKGIHMPTFYFMSDSPYDKDLLKEQDIIFKKVSSGKLRPYFSFLNFVDLLRVVLGILTGLFKVFLIFPDVIFAKGGYASFPALFAAKILRIPVVIHESDTIPGRVNKWAGKFALRVALSFPEAQGYFDDEKKIAVTGQPLREEIIQPIKNGSFEYFGLGSELPIISVLGGSQGAQAINDAILDCLPELLEFSHVIHQVGEKNKEDVEKRSGIVLENKDSNGIYKYFSFHNPEAIRRMAGISSLIISRAGSTIFEIAHWGIPSIIIPIPESVSHDQKSNAIAYSRTGAATLIEQENLSKNVLISEISRILQDKDEYNSMHEAASSFGTSDAAMKVAHEILEIGKEHV